MSVFSYLELYICYETFRSWNCLPDSLIQPMVKKRKVKQKTKATYIVTTKQYL